MLRFADSRSTASLGRLLNCNWESRLSDENEVTDQLADSFHFTEQEREELLPSGQALPGSEVVWASLPGDREGGEIRQGSLGSPASASGKAALTSTRWTSSRSVMSTLFIGPRLLADVSYSNMSTTIKKIVLLLTVNEGNDPCVDGTRKFSPSWHIL